ncbi:TlpA family protein disulfide reductase [Campylobacterota bacterium]
MHKIGALLLLILLIIVIIFIDFKDEKSDTSPIPVEDTTEVFTKKDSVEQEDKRFKIGKKQDELLDTLPTTELSTPEINFSVPEQPTEIFTLVNTKAESHNVTVSGQKVIFQNMAQPIVIINLFATWCPPCIGEIPYLNDLQKKHKKELFVVGILTHDSIMQADLETFMAKNQINYFISNGIHNDAFANLLATTLNLPKNFPIPLTVMYVQGKYFTHYEGSVPVEMIEYDIQQAKKQLKLR